MNTKTLSGDITKGEITSGGKSDGYRLCANPMWQPLSQISRTGISECRARDGSEDSTPRRTHIFLSLVSVAHI